MKCTTEGCVSESRGGGGYLALSMHDHVSRGVHSETKLCGCEEQIKIEFVFA